MELYKTKNTDKKKDLVNVIKSGLSDLKEILKKCLKMKLKLNSQRRK